MQDLFMYFYQDNCDLNDGNYLIQTTIQCVCCTILVNNFCIYQLLRRSDLELISMNYQSHTHQIMVM